VLLEYQLRIRNASTALDPDGTADALTLTSVAGGTNPYITEAPSGDGQEVDPITGSLREGSYTVRVVDPSTGTDGTGTIRLVTNQLEDATYRQQLLSRRCYVEYRQNGGAWTMLSAGYLNAIRLISAIEYEFAIGDSRRIARTKRVFVNGSPSYGGRGTIFGGPVIGGFLGVKDFGGWTFRVVAVSGRQVQCAFVEGYAGPTGSTTRKVIEAKAQAKDSRVAKIDDLTMNYASWRKLDGMTAKWSYPDLRLKVSVNGVANAGAHVPVPNAMVHGGVQIVSDMPMPSTGYHLTFQWDTTLGGAAPAVNAVLRVSCYTDVVSDGSPLYIDTHPIDLVTSLWTEAGIAYDAAAATAVKARIGVDVRLALRITESQLLTEFIEHAVFGPFGVSARTNAAGALELFTTRLKDAATPALTVATADLRSGDTIVFDLDEATVVTSISIEHKVYTVAPDQTPDTDNPFDGVLKATSRVESSSGDTTAFGTKQVEFTIPGMVHLATSNEPDLSSLIAATALEIFDRFGRGAPAGEVEILATAAAAAAKVGEELYVTVPHYPNKNYRIGESSVGARIMQLVRRTEAPEGPRFKLVDSGLAQQPIAPAATISIAANAGDPTTVAEFTVTNAAAINAAAVLQVAVEWATGGSSPTDNGQAFARYGAASCPTGAELLPPVEAGSKVWVRARTEQAGRRPSAWTAWTSVTLTALSAPAALTVSAIKKTAATLSWTNGSVTDDTEVFVYQGALAPADWAPYKVARLAAGSTRALIRSLSGPTIAYQVAVCHVDASGTRSAFATSSLTTNSTLDGCPRPAGFAVIANREDAQARIGIALALWAADTTIDIAIERAPDSGGSPGAYVEIARAPGTTSIYIDDLPSDGLTYWYRIRHSLGGLGDSSYTAAQSGTPGGIPAGLVRPDPVAPVIDVANTESGTTGTTTLTITDPQGRVTLVEFRTKSDPGAWSAWAPDASVPYSASVTIPSGSGVWARIGYRVTGYDALGVERYLAAGEEQFDLNLAADLVGCAGTFNHDGYLLLSIAADSDTASLKFAASAGGYPTAATVRAAGYYNVRALDVAAPTATINVGATVFVSILLYTAVNAGGTESVLFQYRFTREGSDVRVQEKCSESGTTGTVQLVTTDPNGRISSWEYRTQVARGAWSGWAAMTNTGVNTYEATVSMVEKIPSKIGWRIIGTSLTGIGGVALFENVVTFAMGPVPIQPVVEAAVLGDGTVNVSVIGDSDTASIQVGYSTVSAAAADAALGGTVNARQTTFVNVGAGSLTLGQRAYISVKAWSGTSASGSGSVIAQVQVARFNSADSITSRVPGSCGFSPSTEVTGFGRGIGDYAAGPVAAGTTGYHYGFFVVPNGVTLRALRFYGYCADAADVITAKFYRIGSVQMGATQTLTGGGTWTAVEVTSLSEDTNGRAYVVQVHVSWNAYPGPPSSILLGHLEAEYDKTSINQNI
jgi:hypothetical protein